MRIDSLSWFSWGLIHSHGFHEDRITLMVFMRIDSLSWFSWGLTHYHGFHEDWLTLMVFMRIDSLSWFSWGLTHSHGFHEDFRNFYFCGHCFRNTFKCVSDANANHCRQSGPFSKSIPWRDPAWTDALLLEIPRLKEQKITNFLLLAFIAL